MAQLRLLTYFCWRSLVHGGDLPAGNCVSLALGWDSAETRFSAGDCGAPVRKEENTQAEERVRPVTSLLMPVQNTLTQRIGQVPPPWIIITGGCAVFFFYFFIQTIREAENTKTAAGWILSARRASGSAQHWFRRIWVIWRPNTLLWDQRLVQSDRFDRLSVCHIHIGRGTRAVGMCTRRDCMAAAAPVACLKKQDHKSCWLYEKLLRAQPERRFLSRPGYKDKMTGLNKIQRFWIGCQFRPQLQNYTSIFEDLMFCN